MYKLDVLQITEGYLKARKRAPGGGRKPRGKYSNLSATLTMRMPNDLRQQLEVAADKRGESLAQEMIRRLHHSLRREMDVKRDPAPRAMCFLLAQVIETVGLNVRPREWRADPFAYQTMKLAFNHIVDALAPPGEIKPPSRTVDFREWGLPVEPGLSWSIPGTGNFAIFHSGHQTPEAMAEFTRDVILMR